MSIKFKPLKDRVFVSYTNELEKTAGGLYIPDTAKEKPQTGKVEAVGEEVKQIKVGDKILFDKYSGSKINIDNSEYLIVKEEDVLGILAD
ncbi:MAG TPA: co-chaperone GroES [Nitrospirota bacterium]|jgi:chaperonin GroES|nr:co-chaperone GroES [Nitrospirota bacterium]